MVGGIDGPFAGQSQNQVQLGVNPRRGVVECLDREDDMEGTE